RRCFSALQGLGLSGRLTTAFVERVNLSVRQSVAALMRRSWSTLQDAPQLLLHLEWWRAYYHFVRPHESLRVKLSQPIERGGKRQPQREKATDPSHGGRTDESALDSPRRAGTSAPTGADWRRLRRESRDQLALRAPAPSWWAAWGVWSSQGCRTRMKLCANPIWLTNRNYPRCLIRAPAMWIIHKPHPNAVKRMSHVKDARHKQTCDFCAPTSFGLFVSLLTKRRLMPSKCGKQAVVVEPVEDPHH